MRQFRQVALVGLNYMPRRGTGDKNFWTDLVSRLAEHLDQINIISIRDETTQRHEEKQGDCLVKTRFLPPRLLSTPTTSFSARSLFVQRNVFPFTLGIMEKFLNVRRIASQLLAIHLESPIDHIHLMDNFGLANRVLAHKAALLDATISVSAISYMDRNPFLYHPYLLASYKIPNLTVIPYSRSLKARLASLGIETRRLHRIPWGVSPTVSTSPQREANTQSNFQGGKHKPLILWAGYLQQIQRTDFIFALNTAKKALQTGLEATFCFAFKPECYESSFSQFHDPDNGISVLPTDVDAFAKSVDSADIFFSPVVSRRCILAPPLTWIEMLSRGIPILTTRTAGAEEIITEGQTGYMASDSEELIQKLRLLCARYAEMRPHCIEKTNADYNIDLIARDYIRSWYG